MRRCSTFISEGAGMFELRDASAGYKETVIVHHASLRVDSGEIVALLGRRRGQVDLDALRDGPLPPSGGRSLS
jgi:hypothetical protein